MTEPWSRNYTASAWDDPLDSRFQQLMPLYNAGTRRDDLSIVGAIAKRVLGQRVARDVAVVGTNGKTSTSHYLAELLEAAGVKTGLYTSPHIRAWNERIRIGLEPVDSDALWSTLTEVHEIAQEFQDNSGAVRFFDVLTLTAERLFEEAGVQVGVFEAGIGGRLDATRVLSPDLTLLTSIGTDHEELLGTEATQRLREKAGVVPAGGRIIASRLDQELDAELRAIAGQNGLNLTILEAVTGEEGEPGYQAANRALARAGATELLGAAPPAVDLAGAEGRFQTGFVDGVPFIADVAHNPSAWDAFLDAVTPERYVGVVAISKPRSPRELIASLRRRSELLDRVIITGLTIRPAEDPIELAAAAAQAGLPAIGNRDPQTAFTEALELARKEGRPLLVFGSNYLVVDFLAWVARRPQTA